MPTGSRQPPADNDNAPLGGWSDIREIVSRFGESQGEWAGVPVPMAACALVVEPRYPYQGLQGSKFDHEDDADNQQRCHDEAARLFDFGQGAIYPINSWWSERLEAEVIVYTTSDNPNAKRKVGLVTRPTRERTIAQLIHTIGCVHECVWTWEVEQKAQRLLKELVAPHMFDYYRLTGMILETSKRSGVTYLFRRLAPTIAFRADDSQPYRIRFLASLCLHPVGYYDGSFGGVLTPTDDVIAHLLLMRADEHGFWKKANHHNCV